MSKTRVKAGVMVAAMFCTSLALAEDGAESVTVKLSGGSTAVGVGANWGDGILTFEGYQYPFSVRGLTIGDVGAHGFTGSGSVHNLKRPEDFSGNYTGLGGGLTVAGGGSLITMRNQNGVTINLVLTTRGLKVGLGGGREGEWDDSCNAAATRFHAAPGTIQRLVRELGLHGSSASGSGARVR